MSFFVNPIIEERERRKVAAEKALIESRKKAAAELGISYESYVARFIKLKETY